MAASLTLEVIETKETTGQVLAAAPWLGQARTKLLMSEFDYSRLSFTSIQ
jgi:hypothetical protein